MVIHQKRASGYATIEYNRKLKNEMKRNKG